MLGWLETSNGFDDWPLLGFGQRQVYVEHIHEALRPCLETEKGKDCEKTRDSSLKRQS